MMPRMIFGWWSAAASPLAHITGRAAIPAVALFLAGVAAGFGAAHSSCRWEEMSSDQLDAEREAIFVELLAAFGRRDLDVIRAAMRADVVLVLPGSSPLAGTHRGIEEVTHFVSALRMVLGTGRHQISFEHQGDVMVVRHQVSVYGPQHAAEWSCISASRSIAVLESLRLSRLSPKTRGSSTTCFHTSLGNAETLKDSLLRG